MRESGKRAGIFFFLSRRKEEVEGTEMAGKEARGETRSAQVFPHCACSTGGNGPIEAGDGERPAREKGKNGESGEESEDFEFAQLPVRYSFLSLRERL